MRTAALFTPSQDEIDRLVADHPLATLVSIGDVGLRATYPCGEGRLAE